MCRPGRLDKLLYVDLPTAPERVEVLRAVTRKTPLADDVDLERIATSSKADGLSGADLSALAREAAVLAREQAVCTRENAVRAAQDNVKDSEAKLTQAWALYRMQLQQAYQAERENIKPHQNHQLPNLPTVEPEVVARVASRPSMVPRRPLDERRSR